MIINIDHIAYSSLDVQKDIASFEKEGYSHLFDEELENLDIKEKYLTKYNPKHILCIMNSKVGYNIEILNHGSISENTGYISLNKKNEIIVSSNNIEESKKFWTNLGFKITEDENRLLFTSLFPPPLKKQYGMVLKQSELKEYKLDDKGFNCIALITTAIEKDIEKIKDYASVTAIKELTVNSKKMKICFLQSKNNELVELIEVVK